MAKSYIQKEEPFPIYPMTVLNAYDTERVKEAMKYIIEHKSNYKISVRAIRKKFGLSREAYNMIFEFCMPFMSEDSRLDYYKTKYRMLRSAVRKAVRAHEHSELGEDIWKVLQENKISKNNVMAAEDEENYDIGDYYEDEDLEEDPDEDLEELYANIKNN